RQRSRACRSPPGELDGPQDRAVTIDAAGAARAIETIKREKLAGYEAPRGVGGEAFRAGRAGCKQDQNHHRQPSNHTGPSPVTPSDRSLLLDELPQRYRDLPASSRQLKASARLRWPLQLRLVQRPQGHMLNASSSIIAIPITSTASATRSTTTK